VNYYAAAGLGDKRQREKESDDVSGLGLYLLRRYLLLQIHRAESAYLKYTASRQLRTSQTSTDI